MSKTIEESIRDLCEEEDFAVLATQGQEQPYTSLVGFVSSSDLKYIAFATPKETRKYFLLEENEKVAFMVDDRSDQPGSIKEIRALTITGNARILTEAEEESKWGKILVGKHPYLDEFVKSSDTALVVVEVFDYFYVEKFQEVSQWSPKE